MLVLMLLLCSSSVSATQLNWHNYHSSETSRINYRTLPSGVTEIQAELTTTATLGSFLHLLEATDKIREWVPHAASATIIAEPSSHTHIVHTTFDGMFLIAAREMVTRSYWQQDPTSKIVTIQVSNASDDYEVATEGVLMTNVDFSWTIAPLEHNRIRIQYQGYADPAGNLPQFIARRAALRAMKKTLAQLPQALENYSQSHADLVEP